MNLETQLTELMTRNHKRFLELMERTNGAFKDKFNKDLFSSSPISHVLDGSSSDDYFLALSAIETWIDKAIDDIRNVIRPLAYPLFVYLYLEMLQKDYWEEGKSGFI
jgi:hypothetical protein